MQSFEETFLSTNVLDLEMMNSKIVSQINSCHLNTSVILKNNKSQISQIKKCKSTKNKMRENIFVSKSALENKILEIEEFEFKIRRLKVELKSELNEENWLESTQQNNLKETLKSEKVRRSLKSQLVKIDKKNNGICDLTEIGECEKEETILNLKHLRLELENKKQENTLNRQRNWKQAQEIEIMKLTMEEHVKLSKLEGEKHSLRKIHEDFCKLKNELIFKLENQKDFSDLKMVEKLRMDILRIGSLEKELEMALETIRKNKK